jgi:hypothetical protein
MRRVICAPVGHIPEQLLQDVKYFSLYGNPHRNGVGYVGPSLPRDIRRAGFQPSTQSWDFATIALSVVAADNSLLRSETEDGWTRQIGLEVYLHDPQTWEPVRNRFEKMLRFLTGDFWYLTFTDGGLPPPAPRRARRYDTDCVCLLSGGMDSLIGAINLSARGRKPTFVSQVVQGNAEAQRSFAHRIRSENPHLQWSHKLHAPDAESEDSTRARSIVFIAYAALATALCSAGAVSPVEVHIPENGFISLNVALDPLRIGSFSTKTTHPKFITGIQDIWNAVGIPGEIRSEYRHRTKGEMISSCENRDLLLELIGDSTSCGKFGRHGRQHCGCCVPCMVRRAAFSQAGLGDTTLNGYRYLELSSTTVPSGGRKDVSAMALACLQAEQQGIDSFIKGALSFCGPDEKVSYKDVVRRGLAELNALLISQGVL